MLRIADAVRATATVEPVRLCALRRGEAGLAVRTLTVRNDGPAAVTYEVSHQPALATSPSTFTPSFFNAPTNSRPERGEPDRSRRRDREAWR